MGFKKPCHITGIIQFITILGLAYTVSLTPAYSQQIITDGYTSTNLNVKGNVTDVTTNTVKGQNAFNSFKQFDVNKGNTVNLVVPDLANNLINLVKDKTSNIDGTLNSVRKGAVGGNVYLINPHGVVVGSEGRINVGSLTTVTPTKEYVDKFFDSANNPNEGAVKALLEGTAPINKEASVVNSGVITAENAIKVQAGNVVNNGTVALSDLVNTGELKEGSKVEIVAEGNITLSEGSLVKAEGREVYIYANNDTYFKPTAVVDVSSVNNDAGHIELSAKNFVEVAGTFKADSEYGKAGSVLVDPLTLNIGTNQYSDGADFNFQADNTLTISPGIIISSRNIANPSTGNHISDLSQGKSGNIVIQSANITIGDNSKIYGRADSGFIPGNITITASGVSATPGVFLGGLINTNGTVQINSNGNIGNATVNSSPQIVGGVIILNTTSGGIGTADSYFQTDLFSSSSGSINVQATADVYLKSSSDMRIGQITTQNTADVYLTTNNTKILNSIGGVTTNITARNLFIKMLQESQNFYFVGINGDATSENTGGFMTYYLNTLKNNGQNWLKMPSSNQFVFDDTLASFTKDSILNTLRTIAGKMKKGDMLLIAYNGHGYGGDPNPQFGEDGLYNGYDGTPVDENNGKALNVADEGLSLENFDISDDEFADALKNSRGTVVFFTDQCYGGGMFGGSADLDAIANSNGFNFFGITGNIEGRLAWGSDFNPAGTNYAFVGNIHQSLINTLTQSSPTLDTMNADATSSYDWHAVNLSPAYNANGNVYLNEWYNAVNKETYYSWYSGYTYHYPYTFTRFSNMDSTQLVSNPVLYKTWSPSPGAFVDSVGTSSLPVKVNLSGRLDVSANNAVNITGNITGNSGIISNAGAVNLSGTLGGNINILANNIVTVNATTGNLNIDQIKANNSTANITAAGNILDIRADETANVIANNINLNSSNSGTIGTANNDIDIDLNTGILNALAFGLINVQEINGDINLNVASNAGRSDVILSSSGSILDYCSTEDPNIYAKNITLNSTNGGVGTTSNDLNIYLNYGSTGGVLNVTAPGIINLNQNAGHIMVNKVTSTSGDVKLVAWGNILDSSADENANITGKNISLVNVMTGSMGLFSDSVDIHLNGGALMAQAYGYIGINETTGNMNLDLASNAGRSSVNLSAFGSILDARATEDNIYAQGITLISTNGTVGSANDDLDIYLNYNSTGGVLSATASGIINLDQNAGHIMVNKVTSTSGDVKLVAWGNILDSSADENANITGKNISLVNVMTGSMGLFSDSVDIHLNGGALMAQAYGYIGINETTGNMNLDLASNAGRSSVNLSAFGSILDARATNDNIYAQGITLKAINGDIGSTNNYIHIYLNYNSTGGVLNATAKGNKYIQQH